MIKETLNLVFEERWPLAYNLYIQVSLYLDKFVKLSYNKPEEKCFCFSKQCNKSTIINSTIHNVCNVLRNLFSFGEQWLRCCLTATFFFYFRRTFLFRIWLETNCTEWNYLIKYQFVWCYGLFCLWSFTSSEVKFIGYEHVSHLELYILCRIVCFGNSIIIFCATCNQCILHWKVVYLIVFCLMPCG